MKRSKISDQYGSLTADERFKLIVQAVDRGDQPEQDDLLNSGKRINIPLADHAPTALAFMDLAAIFFTEIIEAAQKYHEVDQDLALTVLRREKFELTNPDCAPKNTRPSSKTRSRRPARPDRLTEKELSPILEERTLELKLARACEFRQLVRGWVHFCRAQGLPPFVFWKKLTGFARIRATLKATKRRAYTPRGHMAWLNRIRPKDEPPLTSPLCTAQSYQKKIEECYRYCLDRYATISGG